ncbi:Uncharacterised protein [Sphingobacterium multivorum]|uniref:Uncharacterized protein n=1 Tax=Sphingobacterium multivorum TaxID=28454 RepID=A0A653XXZ6_SPHMU|nr:Uncharacterised protein [Sphingobacterium multivorum]VXC35044.1 conserved hypothetical protein [Sphingobacterium multivorum]
MIAARSVWGFYTMSTKGYHIHIYYSRFQTTGTRVYNDYKDRYTSCNTDDTLEITLMGPY